MWKSIGWPLSSFFSSHCKKSSCNFVQLILARNCCRKSEHVCDGMGSVGRPHPGGQWAASSSSEWHSHRQCRIPEAISSVLPSLGPYLLAHSLLTWSMGRHSWSSLAGSVEQFWARETWSVRRNFLPAAQTCFIHRFITQCWIKFPKASIFWSLL